MFFYIATTRYTFPCTVCTLSAPMSVNVLPNWWAFIPRITLEECFLMSILSDLLRHILLLRFLFALLLHLPFSELQR